MTKAPQNEAGLCGVCRHVRLIVSDRGVTFYQCELSFVDARFSKYPRIPVIACSGYQPTPTA